MEYDPAHKTSSVTSTSSNYDPAHKTTSVTSTNSNLSIWDPLPSLYTGRADSVSSVYEIDDLQEPFDESFNRDYHQEAVIIPTTTTTDESSINDFLNSFFKQEEDLVVKKEQVVDHEVPSSTLLCHGNRKRPYQQQEDEAANNKNRELLSDDQKRANHIASEQKRRNTIRGGFKELTEIIPTLKNINNSKSTILFKSVDYIKQLDKRNKSLKERLALLQARVQQKAQKKLLQQQQQQQQQRLPPNAVAALLVHKNQQKQLELLQEQLRVQQALLTKHNIQSTHTPLYPSASDSSVGYHSISIPAMDDTPVHSTTTSPTLPHASLPVNNNNNHPHSHHSIYQHYSTPAALVMPASQDEWQHASFAPSFTIPADDETYIRRERLLSSGKLNHLRKQSYM